MRLGLGLSWSGRSASAVLQSAFSPADLFASGETGAWYDLQDESTMTIARDGTGPSPTPGQVIGRLFDQSGNGQHFEALSDAARPLLINTGSNQFVRFDGVDDALSLETTSTLPCTVIVAATLGPGISGEGRALSLGGSLGPDNTTAGYTSIAEIGEASIQTKSNGVFFKSWGGLETPRIYELAFGASTVTLRGNDVGSSTHSFTLTADRWRLGAAADNLAKRFAEADIFSVLIINRALTTAERTDTYQYMAQRSGITL